MSFHSLVLWFVTSVALPPGLVLLQLPLQLLLLLLKPLLDLTLLGCCVHRLGRTKDGGGSTSASGGRSGRWGGLARLLVFGDATGLQVQLGPLCGCWRPKEEL